LLEGTGFLPLMRASAYEGEVAEATRRRICDSQGVKQSCEGRRG